MNIGEAIDFAERQKSKWESSRGSKIVDYIWYVITFNKEYIVVDSSHMARHPETIKKVVYDTNVGVYKKILK
jgi:hypothetical protein